MEMCNLYVKSTLFLIQVFQCFCSMDFDFERIKLKVCKR